MAIVIVIIALVLTVAAFFVKSGMLYAICIPAWLICTFYLYNITWPVENSYMAVATASFGVLMTIMMMALTAMHYIGNRSAEPTYDEEKAANLRKIYGITHKKNPWED